MKVFNITPLEDRVKSCDNCVYAHPDTCRMCRLDREESRLETIAEQLGTVSLYKLHPKKTLLERILGR
jgi:Zn-finger protein